MNSSSQSQEQPLPLPSNHSIPHSAKVTAYLMKRVGWLGFWIYLISGAVMVALLVLAIISRSLDDSDRTFWVGLSIFTAIISCLAVAVAVWLAYKLTRYARQLLFPFMKPTPNPDAVQKQVMLTILVSMAGLGIGLVGTELSAVSLLAKTLAHPQGAALYSPESTLRVLDVMVILVNGGFAIAHFFGVVIYAWLLQKVQTIQ